ncbi:hypothetical protein JW711_02895 [Candidatus Woesearchaeota archaeon]|nr:hypothetical protein [Candidatus Woesearchaeota archaeon]
MVVDLTSLVTFRYDVGGEDPDVERRTLKRVLSKVPCSFGRGERNCTEWDRLTYNDDLMFRAELFEPSDTFVLLSDYSDYSYDEFDDIGSRIITPYPRIYVSGESMGTSFYRPAKQDFADFMVADENSGVWTFSRRGYTGFCVLFENRRKSGKGYGKTPLDTQRKLNYIEAYLVGNLS